jgi:hypothetical protein
MRLRLFERAMAWKKIRMATLANRRLDTMNSTSPVLAEALLQTNDARGRWCRVATSILRVNRSTLSKVYLRFFETIRRLIFSYLFSKSGIYETSP